MINFSHIIQNGLIKSGSIFVISISTTASILILITTVNVKANAPITFTEDFTNFTAAGFDPNPGAGQLDSDAWLMTGFSDGNMTFGISASSGDFTRGQSPGGITTGGVYAFATGGGNIILGVQPIGADFTPGDIILRLQNDTGVSITDLHIAYDVWFYNDQNRANSLNFSYSIDDITYAPVTGLDFITPETADGSPMWHSVSLSTTVTGLNLAPDGLFYLKWTGDDVSGGGGRDEYGLDNVQVTIPAGADAAPFVTSTTPPGGATDVALAATIALQFSEAVNVAANWVQVDCVTSGSHDETNSAISGGPTAWTIDPNTDFAPGEQCTVTVMKDRVTDQDGTSNPIAADHVFAFTVVSPISGWVINEIQADPDAANGDANGDGTVDATDDEFVEIINNTGGPVDISGWRLADSQNTRHTFPAGTIVPDQCAIVVFGGGTAVGAFGSALVQISSGGTLSLNNGGDTLTFSDTTTDQTTYLYGGEANDNQALTRDPDLTGPESLVKHTTAAGAGGRLFSPGTRVDGSLLAGCSRPYVLTTTPLDAATNVAVDAPLTIRFSEPVTAAASAFILECPSGAAVAFNVSPGLPGQADQFTLTPNNADLPYNTTCTMIVNSAEVTDLDDTPDPMAADYPFSFQTAASPPPPSAKILISEFVYDGTTPSTEGDEFVELCNSNLSPVDLTGYKVGDEETRGGGESMYLLPDSTSLEAGLCLIIAKNAQDFQNRYGFLPDLETASLQKYPAWGSGSWSLSNTGDELVVLGRDDEILDSVAYRNGDYAGLGLEPDASAPEPKSLQRVWPIDTDSMPYDFVHTDPTPGIRTEPPAGLVFTPPANLPGGMKAYWGHLHAHTTYSDGSGPPHYALALAQAAGLHFYAITDHCWWLTDQEWTAILTQTLAATSPGQFIALRGVEWTHDTVGHINIFNTNALLRRTDPLFDELADVYTWLAANPTAIAQFNHPDPTYGGTFYDFAYHPAAAQTLFLQEIGNNAQRYTTYEPSFVQSNAVGWRVAPTINGDTHTALWGSDTPARTGIVAPVLTEAGLLDALRARRVFATEDRNLALALRLDGAWMGSVLTASGTLPLVVDFVDPDPEPLTVFIYDGNLLLASQSFSASTGQWNLAIDALPGHYYWVKVEQADGDRAYSAPVWLDGQPPADRIYLNEILPAPQDWDWDGNGVADHTDEWTELYNPMDRPVGLGGWRLADSSGIVYSIPLGMTIPPGGRLTFYQAQTGFSLNNGGDTVTLTHPNGAVIDRMSYDHNPGYDETWCRLPDGGPAWSDRCGPSPDDANWEIPPRRPLTVTIYEAKRLTYGAWVRVKGRVTAPPGVLGSRQMYIQDETAGILIYLPKDHGLTLNPGDKVELVGNLRTIYEEFEIAVDEPGDVDFIKADAPPPPLPVATTSLLEPYEGRLVMLQGQAVQFRGRTTLWIDDGTGWAKIYIRASTGINKPFIEVGAPMTVTGIASQHSGPGNPSRDDYQLLPRYPSDLILPDQAPVPAGWPTLLPETGG
jgi:hypothetical protein